MSVRLGAVGLIAGLLLTIAAVTGGLTGFLLAIVFGGVGTAVGLHLDGVIDLTTLAHRKRG